MPEKIGLSYVGPGFYADVPARDLTPEEVEQHGGVKQLTKDGYYITPKPTAKKEVTDGK